MDKEEIVLKRVARQLSLRRRHTRLTADDLVKSEQFEKILLLLLYLIRRKGNSTKKMKKLKVIFSTAFVYYIHLLYHVEKPLDKPNRMDRDIESFEDGDCYVFFRFTKPDLHKLVDLLELNETFRLENGEVMSGEELLLRGLYELCSGETKYKISRNVFGRSYQTQGRAFKFFINYLVDNYSHLLRDNLNWWYENGLFEASARAIGEKLRMDGRENLVSHFIDCNCRETERVGGGPAEGGANAARWDPHIQRAFYNGWKSMNGLKHQTVDDAYGFTVDCYGPASLRRNDLILLRDSDINDSFARLQLNSDVDYIIFGDSAYKRQTHVRSYFTANEEVQDGGVFNRRMKRLRISIEWNYGHQVSIFPYLNATFKMKLLQCDLVTKVFIATTLLRNLHTGFYGSQTSRYFDLHIPEDFNHKYLKQLPLRD